MSSSAVTEGGHEKETERRESESEEREASSNKESEDRDDMADKEE